MEFTKGHARRVVITGNSGSGKSRLAQRIAQVFSVPIIDLDEIYWMGGGYGLKRDEAAARELLEQTASQPASVIEGVFGALCRAALPYATAPIWLDLPWEESRAGLMERGLRRGMTESDHAALVAWAAEYWTHQNANSYAGHLTVY